VNRFGSGFDSAASLSAAFAEGAPTGRPFGFGEGAGRLPRAFWPGSDGGGTAAGRRFPGSDGVEPRLERGCVRANLSARAAAGERSSIRSLGGTSFRMSRVGPSAVAT
jgi:hypothetical protein